MRKDTLVTTLMEAGRGCGYEPYTGSQQRMAAELVEFPAVWINPPVMVSQQGRRRGSRIYETEVKLLRLYDEGAGRQRQWADMEEDMAAICRSVENWPGVYYAEAARMVCSEFSATVSGEISLAAKISVKVHFCPACSG